MVEIFLTRIVFEKNRKQIKLEKWKKNRKKNQETNINKNKEILKEI
jgi:hypothetical protein